jgi:hypothetical protein
MGRLKPPELLASTTAFAAFSKAVRDISLHAAYAAPLPIVNAVLATIAFIRGRLTLAIGEPVGFERFLVNENALASKICRRYDFARSEAQSGPYSPIQFGKNSKALSRSVDFLNESRLKANTGQAEIRYAAPRL